MVEIYGLRCPETNRIRYIGKANDSAKRLKTHLSGAKNHNTPVCNWISKLVANGLTPIVVVIHKCDDDMWEAYERAAISIARELIPDLLNIADGGNEPRRTRNNTPHCELSSGVDHNRIWNIRRMLALNMNFFKKRGMTETYNRLAAKMKDYPLAFGRLSKLDYI